MTPNSTNYWDTWRELLNQLQDAPTPAKRLLILEALRSLIDFLDCTKNEYLCSVLEEELLGNFSVRFALNFALCEHTWIEGKLPANPTTLYLCNECGVFASKEYIQQLYGCAEVKKAPDEVFVENVQ